MAYSKLQLKYKILIFVVLTGFYACTPKTGLNLQSRSADLTYKTDSLDAFRYLPDSKVLVKVTHTQDSLQIALKTEDAISLRSLLTNGVSFYIDPESKNKPKYGIVFPAARAEMLQRQEELTIRYRVDEKTGDTIAYRPFEPHIWVDALQKRQTVITDKAGTRFATPKNGRVYFEDNKTLHYDVSFSFEQFGFDSVPETLNLGIISELHQAILAGQQTGGGMGGPPQRTRNDPRNTPHAGQAPTQRLRLIPISAWLTIFVTKEIPEDNNK